MAPGGEMLELQGVPLSGGVAVGRAVCVHDRELKVFRFPLPEDRVESEVERFHHAVAQARVAVQKTAKGVEGDLSKELAAIFDAHQLILSDSSFLNRVEERIRQRQVNAEWAVYRTVEKLATSFKESGSVQLEERVQDLRDVERGLLRALQGIEHHELSELAGEVVLVAPDLTPSEAVRLGREGAVAFALEGGGLTSHTTIIARSLNLPMVGGLAGITEAATDNDPLIVDGNTGRVILHPSPELLAAYRTQQAENAAERERPLSDENHSPATTRDGVAVTLRSNIDLDEEIQEATRFGAAGVGLYRSEFLYIERSPELPTEEEHLATYRRLLESMAPHPVIIRTYDLGGRKIAREVLETAGDNPALGLRGIRLTLARPDVFRTQLRALYRAGVHGDLRIMLPMVATIEEVRRFRQQAAEVVAELEREKIAHRADIPVGIMIEVPAAAGIADHLALEADFFSIGTNDLAQYALAVDRNNEQVAALYQVLHPSILRMIRFVVRSATEAGIEVSICGEMAADPIHVPLLIGLGLRQLSVGPRAIPVLKRMIRGITVRQSEVLVERCLAAGDAAQVEQLLAQALTELAATAAE